MSGQSNKTAYTFLREKSKILPIEQQLKWCKILQTPSDFIDYKKVYENNYFSTIEAKVRSFQIKFNLLSLVTNVQLAGFGIIDSESCSYCFEQPEKFIHFFLECKFVDCFWNDIGDWISTKLQLNIKPSKIHNYSVFKETVLIINFQIIRCWLTDFLFIDVNTLNRSQICWNTLM